MPDTERRQPPGSARFLQRPVAGALACATILSICRAAPEPGTPSAGEPVADRQSAGQVFAYSHLPAIPDEVGFAGMFAGTSGGALIAAGGHRFATGVAGWQGGAKQWNDAIYVLVPGADNWTIPATRLPRPIGDGASVSYGDRVICMGGGDAGRAYADVFSVRWTGKDAAIELLPPLPRPVLKTQAVVLGSTVYVAGGRGAPESTTAERCFWALDLSPPPADRRWAQLSPWPGAPRMMPVLAASSDAVYVFGGIEIASDPSGRPINRAPYHADAYRYHPSLGTWERLPDSPRPLAGSPSPAWTHGPGMIAIFGGIDGAIEAVPKAERGSIQELPNDILEFHARLNQWTTAGRMAQGPSRVNAPTVLWRGAYTIISGEHLPGLRTTSCLQIRERPRPLSNPR